MTTNPDALRLRARVQAVVGAREALVEFADTFRAEQERIARDPYRTAEQRRLDTERLRAEADREYDGLQTRARRAVDELEAAKAAALRKHGKPNQRAEETARAALARGVTPGQLVDRARETDNVELLIATKNEARLIPDGRGNLPGLAQLEEFEHDYDLAIAELLPGQEGPALLEALKLARNPGVDAAEQFAVKTISGRYNLATARLELGFAESDAGEPGSGDGGEESGGGDSE
jgi:hypothetical protein